MDSREREEVQLRSKIAYLASGAILAALLAVTFIATSDYWMGSFMGVGVAVFAIAARREHRKLRSLRGRRDGSDPYGVRDRTQ